MLKYSYLGKAETWVLNATPPTIRSCNIGNQRNGEELGFMDWWIGFISSKLFIPRLRKGLGDILRCILRWSLACHV